MVKEIDQIDEDNNLQVQLTRKYENLLKEVREREGELADFNLALDKVRTHTESTELRDMFSRLQERNEHERNNVDEAFLRAATMERAIEDMEAQAEQIQQQTATRIGSELGVDAEREFTELLEDSRALGDDARDKERLLSEIEVRVEIAQQDLGSDAYRVHARGLDLKRLHAALWRQKTAVEEELSLEQSGEQVRERLLRLIKETNGEIADLEVRGRECERVIAKLHGDVEAREAEVHSARSSRTQASKFEALAAKDKQMDEFIEQFPERMSEEIAQKEQLQVSVVTLLKHISQHAVLRDSLPDDEAKLAQLKSDLSFQQQTQAQAQQTLAVVKAELARRREELQKIQGLDKRVGEELAELRERSKEMEAELGGFKPAEEVRREHAEVKEKLVALLAEAKSAREAMRVAVQAVSAEHDTLERRVKGHAYLKTLSALEKKLQVVRQQNAGVSAYVEQRRRESDYAEAKADCATAVEQLNQLHRDAARVRL
jgi:intraflagellar transport protein 74